MTHCLGLEHRYFWLLKTLEMFQAEEKDSPSPKKYLVVCVDACKQGFGRVPDHAIGQIKVHRKHCGPKEATWELEDAMRLEHPALVQFCRELRAVLV